MTCFTKCAQVLGGLPLHLGLILTSKTVCHSHANYSHAYVSRTHNKGRNSVKFETSRNLPQVLKIVTHTAQLCIDKALLLSM